MEQQSLRFLNQWGMTLLTVWLCLISILITGYKDIIGANHPLQLVLVQKILHPELYPNDQFVQETAYAYASFLWYLVALLSRWVDLSVVLGVLFVVSRLLFLIAAFQIGRAFFASSHAAPLAAMAFIASSPSPLVGAGNPIRDFTEQTSFAVAFVLLGLAALMQRRPVLTASFLGLAMDMNMMYALFGMVYLAVSWVVTPECRKEARRWLISLPVVVLVGAPGIWLTLQSSAHSSFDVQAVWQVAELQFPYHFFPTLWHPLLQVALLGLMGLSGYLARVLPFSTTAARTYLPLWAVIGFFWYLLAWLTPYVFHSLSLLRLHPIRGHDLWMFTAGVFFAGAAATWIDQRPATSWWLFAVQVGMLTVAIVWRRFDILKIDSITLLILAFLLSGILGAGLRALWSKSYSQQFTHATNAWLALLVGIAFLSGRAIIAHAQRVTTAGNWLGIQAPPCLPFAEWARKNTQLDDVFLIPFGPQEGWQDFRHLSQRNVFVHWKDGTAWPYAPWYATHWLQRMRLLGLMEVAHLDEHHYRTGRWTHVRETYADHVYIKTIDETRILQLVTQFRIDYWIAYKQTRTNLPVVYQHGEWKIIKVK
ncbi:hypothetical protein HRbin15_01741 [bacterium HR15]|nr:hypothetical protein HRbin15_01741 [bacterium HR15]